MRRGSRAAGLFGSGAMVALLLLFPLASAGSSVQSPTWSGTWSTNYGTMTLTQQGDRVEGKYTHDQGHLVGRATGPLLVGTWDEAPTRTGPGDAGRIEFKLADGGKSFTGRWDYANDAQPLGRSGWTGTCSSGPCRQNTAQNSCRRPSSVGQTPKCRYKISWVFTQGGRRPAGMPTWVFDVATAGRGSAELEGNVEMTNRLKEPTARVVRTMEITKLDPDTGIAIQDVKLVFRVSDAPVAIASLGGKAKTVHVAGLELAASDDPLCSASDEKRRSATVTLRDGGDVGVDVIHLRVNGCPHHTATFRGSIGPRSAVKVAIVVKPI